MINSMTGYGRARISSNKKEITVEIRSVNHRYFDCSVRVPRIYTFLEEIVKGKLQGKIARGKVDVFITIDTMFADDVSVSLNLPIVEGYLQAIKTLHDDYGLNDDVKASDLMRFPDVLNVLNEEEDTDKLAADVCTALDEAVSEFKNMAEKEGSRLCDDIIFRVGLITSLLGEIEIRSPKCVEEYRIKLEARMKEILESTTIDPQRILTEAALFADKVAITEEIVRLRSHISQLKGMLKKGGAIGRKLDFLVQEFNREANTIGSKANDVEIAQKVVDLKAEIEKIREQVQNIE